MHPKDLSITDFSYVLPPGRIAQFPLQERDQSKLLIYGEGKISENIFANVANHLPENATLIFNDTKVIHARIIFKNENDASIEVFLLEPVEPFHDMQLAIFHHGECTWRCLVGNVKKWREEFLSKKIRIGDEEGLLEVRLKGKVEDDFLVHFSWPSELSFSKVLEAVGFVPLPPYIKRKSMTEDENRYQTLYAFQDGSVAAPTAGLHFTQKIFDQLQQEKIYSEFVTLHVSAGTFLPVKSQYMNEHHMHAEQIVIRKETIEKLLTTLERTTSSLRTGSSKPTIVAVGTTSLRTIESLYWLGKKISEGDESLIVDQWYAYELTHDSRLTTHDSLLTLLYFMEKRKLNQLTAETKLLIAPGYEFKLADGLITNFHLPNSTLLLLVAAFIDEDWRKVYDYALQNEFRFLSYGDGSLLWRKR